MDTQRWILLGILAALMGGVIFHSMKVAKRLSWLKWKLDEDKQATASTTPSLTAPSPTPTPEASIRPGISPAPAAGFNSLPSPPQPPAPLQTPPPEAPIRPRISPVPGLDFEGPPPPAPKGSEAEEAAKLLAGELPKGLPSFSELAAAKQAEASANAEADSAALEALSLRSMIGFKRKKAEPKKEISATPSIEELFAQELEEKQAIGTTPTAENTGPTDGFPGSSISQVSNPVETRPEPRVPAPPPPPATPSPPSPDPLALLQAFSASGVPASGPKQGLRAKLQASKTTAGAVPAAVDIGALERAVLNNPEYPTARRTLAEGYLQVGRLNEAIEAFVQLVDSDVRKESDLFSLGVALSRRGDQEDARVCFLTLRSEYSDSPWAAKASIQLLKLASRS